MSMSNGTMSFHDQRFSKNGKMRFSQIRLPEMHFSKKYYWLRDSILTLKNQKLEKYWWEYCIRKIFLYEKLATPPEIM